MCARVYVLYLFDFVRFRRAEYSESRQSGINQDICYRMVQLNKYLYSRLPRLTCNLPSSCSCSACFITFGKMWWRTPPPHSESLHARNNHRRYVNNCLHKINTCHDPSNIPTIICRVLFSKDWNCIRSTSPAQFTTASSVWSASLRAELVSVRSAVEWSIRARWRPTTTTASCGRWDDTENSFVWEVRRHGE